MVRVSVIIPTFRRPDLLRRCLRAVLSQEFDPETYEVVVADDGDDSETRIAVIALASETRVPVCYVPVNRTQGPAGARNQGVRRSVGSILAFTDDDCVPSTAWLRSAVKAFDAGADAVTGQVVMPLPEEPTDYEKNESGLERAEFVTANCFCRRELFLEVGGFDEEFTAAWREDSALHFALLERGANIVRVNSAVVLHPVRRAHWGVSLRQQRKSMFDALLYKKFPRLFRERIAQGAPWRYYLTALFVVLVLLGGALESSALVALGFVGWGVETARFCRLRLEGTSRSPAHTAEMIVTSVAIPFLSIFWRLYGALRFRVAFM